MGKGNNKRNESDNYEETNRKVIYIINGSYINSHYFMQLYII